MRKSILFILVLSFGIGLFFYIRLDESLATFNDKVKVDCKYTIPHLIYEMKRIGFQPIGDTRIGPFTFLLTKKNKRELVLFTLGEPIPRLKNVTYDQYSVDLSVVDRSGKNIRYLPLKEPYIIIVSQSTNIEYYYPNNRIQNCEFKYHVTGDIIKLRRSFDFPITVTVKIRFTMDDKEVAKMTGDILVNKETF